MLTNLRNACRRLHARLLAWQLRWRIADHECAAACIEADMLTAPTRLVRTRAAITDLQIRLQAVEDVR